VAVAGNIGPTMLQTLADALDLEPVVVASSPHPSPLPEGEGATPEHDELLPSPSGSGIEGRDGAFEPHAASPSSSIGLQADARTASEGEAPTIDDDDDTPVPIILPPPPAEPVFAHLPEVWVLELSSFQLNEAKGFEPNAATVLNITQDHLDWHGSMANYVAAKARVFGQNAVMVINRDDAAVEKLVPAPVMIKGARGRPARAVERHVVRFGLGRPQRPGDYGLVDENGMAWLVRALEADETIKRTRASKSEPEELHIQRLMPADALRVRGRHNAANALAALALASAIDCPLAPMLHGLREYAGEPHRVQYIASFNGVDAFDDSKGTNVGATVAALNGLGDDKAPAKLIVILGGDGKGQDFTPLAEPVRRHVRAVATIGRDVAAIEAALASTGVPLQRLETLQAATRWCFERAHSGDAVLLSPACASLDMFRNYAHRAEVFVSEVQAIVADSGGVLA
jgi:UDP-N-acetylmuramoylalanine--D-glutamate ligase